MFCSLSLLFFVLSLSLSFFFFSSLSLQYQVHAIYYVGRLCVSEPFNEIHWYVCLCLCLPPSLCLSFFFSLSLQHKVPALHFIVQVCVRETFYWRILVIKLDRGFFIIYCATRTAFFRWEKKQFEKKWDDEFGCWAKSISGGYKFYHRRRFSNISYCITITTFFVYKRLV